MNKEYTIEDYIKDNPKDAHIKLYVQLRLTTDTEVLDSIKEDEILNFDMGGVRYNISMADLKSKAAEESENYSKEHL